jgi:hypothetical protein
VVAHYLEWILVVPVLIPMEEEEIELLLLLLLKVAASGT